MPGLNVKRYFFDRKSVLNKLPKAERQALSKGGALVRKIAQRSMRPARMKPIGQLNHDERVRYHVNLALSTGRKVNRTTWNMMTEAERKHYHWRRRQIETGKHRRQRKPRRPYIASRPGEPPRTRKNPLLRKRLFYLFEPARRDVIVGPEWLARKSDVPRLLEGGGRYQIKRRGQTQTKTMKARPYMLPALEKAKPELADMFRDTI